MKIRTKQPVFLFDSGGEFVSDLLKMPSDFCIQLVDVVDPCPSHQHDYLELAYICQGWTQHTLNGKSQKLSAGDFVLVDDKEVHSYDVVGQHFKAVNCMFRPAMIDGALGHCRSFQEVLDSYTLGMGYTRGSFLRKQKIFHDDTGEIRQILDRMLLESQTQAAGYFPMIRAMLTELIILVVRMVKQQESTVGQFSVQWMIDEIHRNPGKVHRLIQYAEQFAMRPETLSRLFAKEMGMGFQQYLRRVRMQMACRLLVESRSPITKIAEECGYEDVKSFRAAFQKETGLPPFQWKQQCASSFHRVF